MHLHVISPAHQARCSVDEREGQPEGLQGRMREPGISERVAISQNSNWEDDQNGYCCEQAVEEPDVHVERCFQFDELDFGTQYNHNRDSVNCLHTIIKFETSGFPWRWFGGRRAARRSRAGRGAAALDLELAEPMDVPIARQSNGHNDNTSEAVNGNS